MLTTNRCTRCGSVTTKQLCPKCHDLFRQELNLLTKFYEPPTKMVEGVRLLLEGLRDVYPSLDLSSPHLVQTPYRVARMFVELCMGLQQDPVVHLSTSFEESSYEGIILVSNIRFQSLCVHHFSPFTGVAHVGYIPDGCIVGLSKINRVVEILSARPQIQEQLTYQVAHTIHNTLKPKGTAVIVEASHGCIETRGVKSKGSITKTSEMLGSFLENDKNCKDEFLRLIRNNVKNGH